MGYPGIFCTILLCLPFIYSSQPVVGQGPDPLVILPSAVRWNAVNYVSVTPRDWSVKKLAITFTVLIKRPEQSLSEELYQETRKLHEVGQVSVFAFNTSHKPNVDDYEVRVDIPGHRLFVSLLFGVPNTRFVSIQTDKGYYKPGDVINLRVLPVTQEGHLFKEPLKLSLINSQGFKVFSDVVQASKRFIKHSFVVPRYSQKGTWLVTASPVNLSLPWMTAQTQIRVEQYSLPKFFVTMTVEDSGTENHVLLTLHARYPHGLDVEGHVLFVCNNKTAAIQGKLENGSFETLLAINTPECSTENGIFTLTGIVMDKDGEKVDSTREYKPRDPNFQIVALRPFYDNTTRSILLYFKSLSSALNLSASIHGKYQCVGGSQNGLNVSFQTKPEAVYEFVVNSNCKTYIIQATRDIGGSQSDEVILFVPALEAIQELKLSLIEPPKKAVYSVGEKFETTLSAMMNYVVICNRNEVAASGTVANSGALSFPVTREMQGFCFLNVYGNNRINNRNIQADMWIFFVRESDCSSEYSVAADMMHLSPPNNLTLTVKATPGSLVVVRAIDERLNHILNYLMAPRAQIYWNLDMFIEPSRETNAPKLVNFLNCPSVYQKMTKTCNRAGQLAALNPVKDVTKLKEVSDLSDYCAREFVKGFNSEKVDISMDSDIKQPLKTGSFVFNLQAKQPKPDGVSRTVFDASRVMMDAGRLGGFVGLDYEDEVFLRRFFPEVWYFDDLRIGSKKQAVLQLVSPHSMSRWMFSSVFWSPGQKTTCPAPSVSVHTRRHVFMEVDLPSHVYENETIKAKIVVNGDNFGSTQQLSVCFTGLSPVVCADMGRDGEMAETEYSRVVLSQNKKRTEKLVYLKFLKSGHQNVSFELREEINVVGGELSHCADPQAKVYDKIVVTVKVDKRLDQKEHFRQINIYPQRKVFRLPKSLDTAAQKPDVVQFNQEILSDNQVSTLVVIDQDVEIIDTVVEFSEFQPSFPLGVASQEIESPRSRRSSDASFSPTLMDYAFATYDRKQSRLNGLLADGSLRQESAEARIQTLRTQLFRFSNCSANMKMCAFGEYGPPDGSVQASLLYTATVTSLMCEENVEDAFVCGPLNYLTNVTSYGINNMDVDFHGQINFSNKEDEMYFIVAVLKQTLDDCSMKMCINKSSMKLLTEKLYVFDTRRNHDIRVEAAVAGVSASFVAGSLRQRIRGKANVNDLPYWKVDQTSQNSVENDLNVVSSADITANSLAMLAFVNQSTDVYDHYRSQVNLPRLAEWLIEEQSSSQRFQTALDTFYAWRALYRYNERVVGPKNINRVKITMNGNDLPIRKYSNEDLPFSVQMPSSTRNFTIETSGDGRIVAGIRVLVTPRKRLKRDDNSSPSILLTMTQSKVSTTSNDVTQVVCIKTKSKLLQTLEIDHNLFTGFTANFDKFEIINGTAKMIGIQQQMETGLHFALTGLTPELPSCYMLIIYEPKTPYTASFLAPVTVDAYYNQVRAQIVIHATDIRILLPGPSVNMSRRSMASIFRRPKRASDDTTAAQLVDTVCLEHGTCTCAELSCSGTCLRCSHTLDWKRLRKSIIEDYSKPERFGVLAQFVSSTETPAGDDSYTRAVMKILKLSDKRKVFGCLPNMDSFILWIRGCNGKCLHFVENGTYMLVGNRNGFFQDTTTVVDSVFMQNSTQVLMQHYLLRDGDTLDGGDITADDGDAPCAQLVQKLFTVDSFPCKK